MARLLIKTAGLDNRTLELRLGVNRVGRDPECDFPIIHKSVSASHCEVEVTNNGVYIRDCGSTNGTFINGDPISEAMLMPGQTVHLGSVELFVENTDVNMEIPAYEKSNRPKPPVVLADGSLGCKRHSGEHATYQCTVCREVLCNHCVVIMRVKTGRPLFLCPLCSHKCEPIPSTAPETKKKKGVLEYLSDTVKLHFKHPFGSKRSE
jgi:pSer/pThr/pTyr-binding forkhead associated (FHA) protein